jgi:Mg-chelatase subunit ChlD
MNVEVEIGGNEAKTDGRRIRLPTLPFDDPEVETLAFGFLEHEAAHIRYTEDVQASSELHHRLCNTIEDIRIERELGREFPGFAANLSRLVTKLVKDAVLVRPTENDPSGIKLRRYLSYRLRAEVLQQNGIGEYAVQAEEIFRKAFPPGACARIGSVIGRVPALESTQDAMDLAGEILSILKEEAQDPPPPPPPPTGDQGGDGAGGASDTAESGNPQAGNDAGSASDATGALPAGDAAADPHAQARANLREILESNAPEMGPEMSETLSKALQSAAQDSVRRSGGKAGGFGRADSPIIPAGDAKSVLAEVREASIALRTRLRSFVESVRHCRRTYRRHGTQVAPHRLVRAMLGDSRIFPTKRLGREVNTAVEMLCDASGSMDGLQMLLAAQSTLTAASGLSAIRGVSLEAAVFPGYRADVELLTEFERSLRATATRYKGVTARGGTPLYEALMWGCERLLLRKEPRKILVCATDGLPPPSTHAACKQVIHAAMAGGIETYGIGILVDISDLFPVSRSINDVSELTGALFGFLQGALTGRTIG